MAGRLAAPGGQHLRDIGTVPAIRRLAFNAWNERNAKLATGPHEMTQGLDPTSDAARTSEDADANREALAKKADDVLHHVDNRGELIRRSSSDGTDLTGVREFSRSSNGDTWLIGNDRHGSMMVLHRGNLPSGGHETVTPVGAFLGTGPRGPQHDALVAMLRNPRDRGDVERTGVVSSLLTELGLISPETRGGSPNGQAEEDL